jgi:FMN phosphatase YigB (HAD superfamily)
MTTIWINKSSEKDTDKNKADFIVTHLKEIFPILKGLIK